MLIQFARHRFHRQIIITIFALACAYLLFPTAIENFITPFKSNVPEWEPLDTSWQMALNYAKINDLVWGKDFVFTYGPLAQLSTRIGWGESRYVFLIFDLFMLLNWFLIFYISLKQSSNKILTALLILILAGLLPIWIGSKLSIYLLLFLVFWIRQGIEHKTHFAFIMQICIISLCFFIKFNSALINLPLFYMALFYIAISRQMNFIILGVYAVMPLLLIYTLSVFLNVALSEYIVTGVEMISGYNEIMYEDYPLPHTDFYLIVVCIVVFVVSGFKFFQENRKITLKKLLLLSLAIIPFFIIYKQGFVRSNPGYNADFFSCMLVYFVTISDFHFKLKYRIFYILVCLGSVLAVAYLYIESNKPLEVRNKISKSYYIHGFKNFNSASDLILKEQSPKFPANILQQISGKTVDAYPFNLRMLMENNLNYYPRPCIQSYSTYTRDLENINFEHYNSVDSAPEFVIYEHGALDNRYPIFDESKVILSLQLNYEFVQIFEYDTKKLLLLHRKKNFKKITFQKVTEYAMMVNSPLVPKDSIYYEVELYKSTKGQVYSFFRHAPEIILELQKVNGGKLNFRTSAKLLQSGLYGSEVFENTQDFANSLMGVETSGDVRYYNFRPMNESMIKEKIKVTEYKIIQ